MSVNAEPATVASPSLSARRPTTSIGTVWRSMPFSGEPWRLWCHGRRNRHLGCWVRRAGTRQQGARTRPAQPENTGAPCSLGSSSSRVASLGPVVLAGVYYSGAKDIAVLLHDWTGLGAFDVSRYVGELTTDVRALRTE